MRIYTCLCRFQISVLKHTGTQRTVLVVNTHLKSGREFCHIRALQMIVCLQHVHELQPRHPGACVVLAGDLNSPQFSAVVDFISSGRVSDKHVDWFIGGYRLLHICIDVKFNCSACR